MSPQDLKEQINCLTEARDQMMAKLQSLKTKAKDRLEENDEQIQTFKTTNNQLKEMLDSSEKEQEKLKSEMHAMELSKQVIEPCHEKTGLLHLENKDADQLCGNREAD